MKKIKKPELLCPAKDLEVLKTAVDFGADAVYIGGEAFSLRAKARNFSLSDMAEGISYAHEHGARVHVTANILAHNRDIDEAAQYFRELSRLRPDAVLIADPGMFMLAKRYCPDIDIHISTQANNTNYQTFLFWHDQGAKRVVCARELGIDEIRQIREAVPEDLEVEAFVHGAMCISYSGRCLLSSYLAGRDANHGECTHPCRWKYTLMERAEEQTGLSREDDDAVFAVEEQTRPGEYMPVYENERGTYLFNSRDLCMIEHIPELVEAGIDSLKIEGRMKTALYVATVARTYRKAIDDYFEGEDVYRSHMEWYRSQIRECTYRRFTTGFYFGRPSDESMVYDSNTYINEAVWLGIAEDVETAGLDDGTKAWKVTITQRNKFKVGDSIEIMKPDGENVRARVLDMINGNNEHVPDAPHPLEKLFIVLDKEVSRGDILRMKTAASS